MKDKWNKWNLRFLMAILIIILIFSYIFVLMLVPGAKENENETITGILLTGGFSTVMAFFYGSSDKKGKDVPEEGLDS